MNLDDLRIYRMANDIADIIWNETVKWDYLAKDTVGKQLIRSADSMGANIAEGYGRFHFKENKIFFITLGVAPTKRGIGLIEHINES